MRDITKMNFASMVMADNGKAITTSLRVSEHFGKRHSDVLRKVKSMQCSSSFNRRNFALVEYVDSKGQKRPMVEMTKDGFIFLAFGFTGKQADMLKERYIEAFNWMLDRLRSFEERRNTVSARYSAEQVTGSMCGRGLSRWKNVKRDLEDEMELIKQEGQLTIPFVEYPRIASNEEAA